VLDASISGADWLSVRYYPVENAEIEVVVEGTAPAASSKVSPEVIIHTDSASVPELRMKLSGAVRRGSAEQPVPPEVYQPR
jgi:hypothetical protein